LPPAIKDFCVARRDNPELSLTALGELFVPPVSKSAMYHRLLRLEKIVQDLEKDA
ncbi:MAG: DNA-binding protein WhiA, partial [Atopobium sp.]|nr:DNA-binding protein WhiA [Atopobium sp.]